MSGERRRMERIKASLPLEQHHDYEKEFEIYQRSYNKRALKWFVSTLAVWLIVCGVSLYHYNSHLPNIQTTYVYNDTGLVDNDEHPIYEV